MNSDRLLREIKIVSVAAFIIIVTVILTALSCVFVPYKYFVYLIAKLCRQDLKGMVSGGMNTSFTLGSSKFPTANILCYFVLDGNPDLEEGRCTFQQRVLDAKAPNGSPLYSKLQQTLTSFMGYSFFKEDKNFELQKHMRFYDYHDDLALPARVTDTDLERLVGKLLAAPWNENQSNWEFLVIQNYYPAGVKRGLTIVVLRVNHALADGYSIHRMVFRMLGVEQPWVWKQQQPKKSVIDVVTSALTFPIRLFYQTAEQHVELLQASSGWAKCDGSRRVISTVSGPISIDRIKSIKNKLKVSYISVILTAVTVAIHRCLTESNEIPPKKMSCVMPIPKANHPGGLTNHVFVGLIPLPIARSANKETVREIQRCIERFASSTGILGMQLLLNLNSYLPRSMFRIIYKLSAGDVVLGVFPVLTEPIFWKDIKVLSCTAAAAALNPAVPFGVAVTMGGANGQQMISIVADKSLFSSEEMFMQIGNFIQQELATLERKIMF